MVNHFLSNELMAVSYLPIVYPFDFIMTTKSDFFTFEAFIEMSYFTLRNTSKS